MNFESHLLVVLKRTIVNKYQEVGMNLETSCGDSGLARRYRGFGVRWHPIFSYDIVFAPHRLSRSTRSYLTDLSRRKTSRLQVMRTYGSWY